MRAGLLNEMIIVYRQQENQSEFGDISTSYEPHLSTRAQVNHSLGNRTIQNNEIFYDYSKTFVVRGYVDIKDTDPEIYRAYTGKEFQKVADNLRLLLSLVGADRVTVRLPLIPDYNTDADVDASEALLRSWGITRFDRFVYRTEIGK